MNDICKDVWKSENVWEGDYIVYGVKELLSKPDLTPEEMAKYRISIKVGDGTGTEFAFFLEAEIQIEFSLRSMGFVPGKEKEVKRIELLKEAGYESMVEFWEKAMEENKDEED